MISEQGCYVTPICQLLTMNDTVIRPGTLYYKYVHLLLAQMNANPRTALISRLNIHKVNLHNVRCRRAVTGDASSLVYSVYVDN